MRPILIAFALTLLAGAASAGPFDALTETDRAKLGDEIRQYLLENPEVMLEVMAALEAEREAEEAARTSEALAALEEQIFNDGISHVSGNPEGDVTIVEFFDYQCSFCKRAHPEVAALLAADGNIRYIQKEFPILGPASLSASRAAVAVLLDQDADVYEDFSDRLMSHNGPLNDAVILMHARDAGVDVEAMQARQNDDDITSLLAENRRVAEALAITGTPTFIVGDEVVRGYLPQSDLQAVVDAARNPS